MSEYNANDHLHNVTASIQQLTYQAQGVQDITGANVADYEQISPDAASSVTLFNARKDVPFLSLVNNLPPVQTGDGTPALDNVRPLTPYTKSIVNNGQDAPIEVILPDDFYGGEVNFINRQLKSDIIMVQIKSAFEWTNQDADAGTYYANEAVPDYLVNASTRYITGKNVKTGYVSASSAVASGMVALHTAGSRRVYIRPDPSWDISSIGDLKTWLDNNPIYIYYRVAEPLVQSIDITIPYVQDSNYVVSVESGTLTVKYQGIAPDEP